MSKSVSKAIAARHSCRAFLDTPVDPTVLRACLEKAQQAPSGGNLQPWHMIVLEGETLAAFVKDMTQAAQAAPMGEEGAYDIYPKGLKEPYRSRRFAVGEALYGSLGIAREDKFKRLMWLANNFRFFGAPVGMMLFVDRDMGPPQWSDLGMYLQTLMLLLEEAGLASCAQESWSMIHRSVATWVEAPAHQTLFCGLAVGHADTSDRANGFRAERAPLAESVTFFSKS